METGSSNYATHIQKHVGDTLDSFNIQFPASLGTVKHRSGKVRDTYEVGQSLLLVTTDRVSAFDRILAKIPFKGQVLNQVSLWWFDKTKHIVQNHVLSCPDPNVVVGKKCRVIPVEFVVRGYMTGTTSTSIWTNYAKGTREYCGHSLPDGLQKNQKLPKNLVTPTTKDDDHDRLITPAEIISEGRMTADQWQKCHDIALSLFEFGQKISLEHGLILVDTKYEFGLDDNGEIVLIDEIHTPDSSRYWIAGSFDERFQKGLAPENIDKDVLRNWYNQHCDPYKDEVLPKAPEDLVVLLSSRYIELYERITGQKFEFPAENTNITERVQANITKYFS
eukprot:TRINITY_DN5880_c0_g1_i1.p1 TRINITY_DN5880_c0_g1~~TRINITY_DN5880_c0_g1_i1.p1  ORF type:complete len:334 (-),score=47.47 TRINITY_DN5880_c0_g1_i1:82-1083(-)